jgi:dTDP-glucose 4,6-dehydratase
MNLMRLGERLGKLKKILYLSSGLVSANTSKLEKNSIQNDFANLPSDPAYIYANSKRFAESICNAATSQSRLSIVMTRPFSFIGPYQSLDNPWAQTTFISDALNGHKIRLHGDGQIMRSYLYGADAAFWFLCLLQNGSTEDVINIGSPKEISLQNLAELISGNFNPSPDIVFNTAPRANKIESKLVPLMSEVLNKYNLAVYTTTEEAIKLTIDWHKCFLKNKFY